MRMWWRCDRHQPDRRIVGKHLFQIIRRQRDAKGRRTLRRTFPVAPDNGTNLKARFPQRPDMREQAEARAHDHRAYRRFFSTHCVSLAFLMMSRAAGAHEAMASAIGAALVAAENISTDMGAIAPIRSSVRMKRMRSKLPCPGTRRAVIVS